MFSSTIPPANRKRPPASATTDASPTKKILANPYIKDRLGTLVANFCSSLDAAASWEEFAHHVHGRSYLSENIDHIDHPARPLLQAYRDDGVPVFVHGEDWTPEFVQECLRRGAHPSAIEHMDFLRDEMADFCERGFWVVLPYDMVKHLPNLKLSPAAVKPERDRRPRLLVDHTWWGVNDATEPYFAKGVMQFGRALSRLLYRIHHSNPKFGTSFLAKFDLSDGFYRMATRPSDAPNLAVVMPKYPDEPQLIAIPLVCTMGWVNSPPSFSAMSETIADITNARLREDNSTPHRLEDVAGANDKLEPTIVTELPIGGAPALQPSSQPISTASHLPTLQPSLSEPPPGHVSLHSPASEPLSYMDVFVDDFIGLCQGSPARRRLVRRVLLHAVDDVLAQPNLDEPHRQEAVSLKKLLKGDGAWDTRKLILGWIIDTYRRTIELPPHRHARLQEIFDSLKGRTRISTKKWQKVIGELRFMSLAIPGSGGLFSALQLGLKHSDKHRVRITKHIAAHLADFERLAQSLMDRPTRLGEIVPDTPVILGTVDACKAGMGGAIFSVDHDPILWRAPFPTRIQRRLVSDAHPTGDITNSDLEQAGILAQAEVITQEFDVRERTVATLSDNTPAISRNHKGAITSDQSAAYLCRLSSLHQRHYRYYHEVGFINGLNNILADALSHWWHLDDDSLLAKFNAVFPQTRPWRMCQLNAPFHSALISCLESAPIVIESLQRSRPGRKTPGASGKSFVPSSSKTLSCPPIPMIPSISSSSSDSVTVEETLAKITAETRPLGANPSEVRQWRQPYKPWERGSPNWVTTIPDYQTGKISHLASRASTSSSEMKTRHPLASGLSVSPSSKPFKSNSKTIPTRRLPEPSWT